MRDKDKSLEKGIIKKTLPGNRKRGRPRTVWRECYFMDGTEA